MLEESEAMRISRVPVYLDPSMSWILQGDSTSTPITEACQAV